MTNPGHVDPGYEGAMRFTVINMAKDSYPLERGGQIVTLLIFRMTDDVHRNWRQKNPGAPRLPTHGDINRLSRDFVNVDERAKKIANEYGIKWSAAIAAGVTLFGILLQLFGSGRLFSRADVDDLKKRQEMVEYDLKNRVNVEQKLQDFDGRLKNLERNAAAVPRQKVTSSTSKPLKRNP